DERRKRQQLAEELARERAELARLKNPRPDDLEDPEGARKWDEQARIDERVNLSYEYAQQFIPDFEQVMEAWPDMLRANPGLYDAAIRAPNPAHYAYEAVKRLKAMQEIGGDPVAYRQRVEAEIRAKIEAEAAAKAEEA